MLKDTNQSQFNFNAVGTRNGKEQTTRLTVNPPCNSIAVAKVIARGMARAWANQNHLQNFRIN